MDDWGNEGMITSWDDEDRDYDYSDYEDYADRPYVDTDIWYYGRWVRDHYGKLGRITEVDDEGYMMYPITVQFLDYEDTENCAPDELKEITVEELTPEEILAWSLMVMKN